MRSQCADLRRRSRGSRTVERRGNLGAEGLIEIALDMEKYASKVRAPMTHLPHHHTPRLSLAIVYAPQERTQTIGRGRCCAFDLRNGGVTS